MLSIFKSPEAESEVAKILEHLKNEDPTLPELFMDDFESALEKIAAFPELGSLWESEEKRFAKVRYWQMKKFENHLVFYKPVREGILILHVLHGAQDLRNIL